MSTVVAFHAHPDDETLLTGGWLAQRVAAGDRVVLVFATDGAAGLAESSYGNPAELAAARRAEGEAAARALGVSEVRWLGYDDSGMRENPATASRRFVDAPIDQAAAGLTAVLDEVDADLLTGYDEHGGYGHPDHVHVHRVARAAQAAAARRPALYEATLDPTWLNRLIGLLRPWSRLLPGLTLPRGAMFTAPEAIDLRVDVRRQVAVKRTALAAHASQATAGVRTVRVLLALPAPLACRVLGTEWFVVRP